MIASLPEFDSLVLDSARLLLGVARLGDMGLRGWWRSRALDFEGQFVLRNTFPRTYRIVGLELALLSATRRHRQALGRPTAIHLFSDRLPFHRWVSGWLAEQKTSQPAPLIAELEAWSDPEAADAQLAAWAGGAPSLRRVAGALELGRMSSSEVQDPRSLLGRIRELAACYPGMDAFQPAYFNLTAD